MEKTKLRQKLIRLRKQKEKQEILYHSQNIIKKLMDLSVFQQAEQILCYVSYNNEVHTHQLIQKMLKMKNKTVIVPISDTKTHTLQISKLQRFTDLKPGAYGILEPKKEKQNLIPLETIDAIIVPGVGFDHKGNRIGQGGSYYDWLLRHSNATTIALAFEFQIIPIIPTDAHDQSVDYIITEKQIINCKQHD
ncbi:MAG: 5-formyltetrahydrofolate cyclo-ligase [Thermoplasmatota archaeon]